MKKEIPILFHDDDVKVHVHSSIDQFSKFIATYERGGWTPIEFDHLDYIDCDKVVSHPVIIEFDDDLGYYFPIDECEFETNDYPLFDQRGVVLRELPECMGEGFYQAFEDNEVIINFDDGTALSTRNKQHLKIGTHYWLADSFLEPDDGEL